MLVNTPPPGELDREVHNDSEDISDAVAKDLLKAILARVKKVDRNHDIPYIAGYSQSGEVIYIDRHMPKSFMSDEKRIQIDPFLIVHETIEKALLDELGLHYVHAHQAALRVEHAVVEATGVSWDAYNRFCKEHGKKISDERLTRVPPDLDLTPYRDEHDLKTLQQLVAGYRSED
ncbi:MAG: hypothetical protein JO366_07615 [Methylobacteriaceae bacterium]|nr:hypothetical protein [Methylobacteriaceae bacterium]